MVNLVVFHSFNEVQYTFRFPNTVTNKFIITKQEVHTDVQVPIPNL